VGKEILGQAETAGGEDAEVVIRVEGLCKSYGPTVALDNVGFAVRRGEVFGYLGPNGAGKTTTINVLCGLLPRDAGVARICGLDIERRPVAVKERIGVVPEESNLYPELSCRRNLEYLGELYGLGRASRRARADELLETFGLSERAEAPFRALSRGMKRRLTVAAALVHSPPVVFLDEPTAGMDVPGARALRSLIGRIRRDGTTVFLTTHNLAEAEALCERILILVKGRVVAEGTSADIRKHVAGARRVSLVLSGGVAVEALRKACPAIEAAAFADGTWRLQVRDVHAAVAQIASFARAEGLRVEQMTAGAVSLEEAFVAILEGNAPGPEAAR